MALLAFKWDEVPSQGQRGDSVKTSRSPLGASLNKVDVSFTHKQEAKKMALQVMIDKFPRYCCGESHPYDCRQGVPGTQKLGLLSHLDSCREMKFNLPSIHLLPTHITTYSKCFCNHTLRENSSNGCHVIEEDSLENSQEHPARKAHHLLFACVACDPAVACRHGQLSPQNGFGFSVGSP